MRKIFVILAVTLALLVALHDGARAQSPALEVGGARSFTIGGNLVFSVKFLCGTITTGLPLAAGTYLTAINIHNIGTTTAKFHLTVNDYPILDYSLPSGIVQSLDCRDLFFPSGFVPSQAFQEGFAALGFNKEPHVNVVPVYTVTAPVATGS